ncbi:MAG: T9SS type A sorting domain-containing protein [Bacteroidota bacterium]|nr:T9SS type A sorting domain-containing protein [Bacteroidota bacterium]
MKRNLFFSFVFSFVFFGIIKAQVLNVPQIIQEQNQWCWAGVSKCILDYYGYPNPQCDIADYARTSITWTSFGTVNCCVDPNQGCNYWNYNYGYPGSIQDILIHFGGIQNNGLGYALSTTEVATESAANRPYIIRWGWFSGGGHFVVGHGISGNTLNYMNPWPGEGLHVSTHSWLVNDGTHLWTHTNTLLSAPTAIEEATAEQTVNIYPNPANDFVTVNIQSENKNTDADFTLRDVAGREVMKTKMEGRQMTINTADLSGGVYFYRVEAAGELLGNGKIVIE